MEPKKLKIFLIYYEPVQSGQTTHVLSLATGLDCRQYTLEVVLPDFLKHAVEKFQLLGIKVHPFPMRKVFWNLEGIKKFVQLIRREHCDMVHIHSQ